MSLTWYLFKNSRIVWIEKSGMLTWKVEHAPDKPFYLETGWFEEKAYLPYESNTVRPLRNWELL